MERKIGGRQLLEIIVFFLIVQFAGLLLTEIWLPLNQISTVQTVSASGPQTTTYYNLIVIAEIIVITAVIIFFFRKYRGQFFFILLDLFTIVPGSTFTFLIVINIILPNLNAYLTWGAALLFAMAIAIAKRRYQSLKNFVVLTSSIGFGVIIGIIGGFEFVYFFLAILAVYDYVAVFVTKHMVSLADIVVKNNIAAMVGSRDVHMVPGSYVSAKERAEVKKSGIQNRIKNTYVQDLIRKGNVPYVSQVGLGGGDLLAPLILTTAVYVTFGNFFAPMVIIMGSLSGIIATMFILKRYKVALPAIPPLFAFENLFLALIFLMYVPNSLPLSLAFLMAFAAIMLIMAYTLNRKKDMATVKF